MNEQEKSGYLLEWNSETERGVVLEVDESYHFTRKEWKCDDEPQTGWVRFLLKNRTALSEIEPLYIEWPNVRLYSDARAWLELATVMHKQVRPPDNLEGLYDTGRESYRTPHASSYTGSLVKCCYGMALELYIK